MRTEQLTIASLNAEYGQYGLHADRILRFIEEYAPQILVLQEVFPNDLDLLLRTGIFTQADFLPQANFRVPHGRLKGTGQWGIGTVTNLSVQEWRREYYLYDEHSIPDVKEDAYVPARGVLSGKMQTESGTQIAVGNIHFIWTHLGVNTIDQEIKLQEVERIVAKQKLDLLAGDFNIPRESPLGHTLSQNPVWKNHIPSHVHTTMDPNLHRNSGIPNHVVDYLFTTPECKWQVMEGSVQVVSGVSDHCAIVATITYETDDRARTNK